VTGCAPLLEQGKTSSLRPESPEFPSPLALRTLAQKSWSRQASRPNQVKKLTSGSSRGHLQLRLPNTWRPSQNLGSWFLKQAQTAAPSTISTRARCSAWPREIGLFASKEDALPGRALLDFITGRCGSTAFEVFPTFQSNQDPGPLARQRSFIVDQRLARAKPICRAGERRDGWIFSLQDTAGACHWFGLLRADIFAASCCASTDPRW